MKKHQSKKRNTINNPYSKPDQSYKVPFYLLTNFYPVTPAILLSNSLFRNHKPDSRDEIRPHRLIVLISVISATMLNNLYRNCNRFLILFHLNHFLIDLRFPLIPAILIKEASQNHTCSSKSLYYSQKLCYTKI